MQVRDIMTHDPACCTPDTDLQAVARMMVEQNCGEIPVVHGSDKRPTPSAVLAAAGRSRSTLSPPLPQGKSLPGT